MALIGDRERERATALLGRHYLAGRLTLEELSERLEIALTARHANEARLALADLPPSWSQQGSAQAAFNAISRAARRTLFVVAVWTLWWAASLALLTGLVASVALQGLSISKAVAFPALWVVCTLLAASVTRRRRG